MHVIIDFIIEIFKKLLGGSKSQEFSVLSDNDERGIINPGQEADSDQIVVPRVYEFTEEERISVLRTHDYIHLPLYAQEQLGKGE